ncbi:MAG: hypothetical protein U9P73_03165 [Candidatus Cloacimonadota bacterium]|nr:hypothetical protein [Candidatus Cloacimonadota bacterium]
MKNILTLLIILILLGACARQSDLSVYNDTSHSIRVILNGTIYQILQNDPPVAVVETYYLNSFILFGETIDVPIIIEGQTYLEPKEFTIKMKPGKDRSYHVVLDRAGLQINNASLVPISVVQLRNEGEEDWSENVIDDTLYTETSSSVLSIIPDYDYIKMTDIFETEYPEEFIEFNAGETTTYIFFGI